MDEILQRQIPYDVFAPKPLPGVAPLPVGWWLLADDAYGAQMAERGRLLAENRAAVLALDESGRAAAEELLETVLEELASREDYAVSANELRRPDGAAVPLNHDDPLGTLGSLVQEDFCILEKRGAEHVLTGAVLCFPASWTLSEKFMRPLTGIHDTVDSYDDNIARRVQRLFDGVQTGRAMWRFNALWNRDATLHQPRSMHDARPPEDANSARYMRSELQTISRLARTNAVIFGIHTFVLEGSVLEASGSP